jgi:MFS family permease
VKRPRILSERRFRLLWAGQSVSALGDQMMPVSIAFAVIGLSSSAADLGLVLTAGFVPRLALLLLGGIWADRLPRQVVMLTSDSIRCCSQGLLALLLISGSATVPAMMALVAVYGGAAAFFEPAAGALVPATVKPERLQQANALMSVSRNVARILGPIIAAATIAVIGVGWTFALDAATFLISGVTLVLLGFRLGEPPERERQSFWSELVEGWRDVVSRSWVWQMIAAATVFQAVYAIVLVLGPIVAADDLGGATAWGTIQAGAGTGAVCGGLASMRWIPDRPLLVGSLAVGMVSALPLTLAIPASLPAITLAAFVAMGGLAFLSTVWYTALQSYVPDSSLSRVYAWDLFGSDIAQPLGFLVAGPLAASLGTSGTLLGVAMAMSLVGSSLALTPSVRRFPSGLTSLRPVGSQ